jgi:hypothetical protein
MVDDLDGLFAALFVKKSNEMFNSFQVTRLHFHSSDPVFLGLVLATETVKSGGFIRNCLDMTAKESEQ